MQNERTQEEIDAVTLDLLLENEDVMGRASPYLLKIPTILRSEESSRAFQEQYEILLDGALVVDHLRAHILPEVRVERFFWRRGRRDDVHVDYGYIPCAVSAAMYRIYAACSVKYPRDAPPRANGPNRGGEQWENWVRVWEELQSWIHTRIYSPEVLAVVEDKNGPDMKTTLGVASLRVVDGEPMISLRVYIPYGCTRSHAHAALEARPSWVPRFRDVFGESNEDVLRLLIRPVDQTLPTPVRNLVDAILGFSYTPSERIDPKSFLAPLENELGFIQEHALLRKRFAEEKEQSRGPWLLL